MSLNNSFESHSMVTKVRRLLADNNSQDWSQKETSLWHIISLRLHCAPSSSSFIATVHSFPPP